MRQYDLNKSYGITVEQYNSLFSKQGGRCAVCLKTASEKGMGRKKHLCVDHNHSTGEIRGLLCDPCNRGIGLLQDDYEIISNAVNYLKNQIVLA